MFESVSNGFGKLYSSIHINAQENGIEADADKPVSFSSLWFIWLLTLSFYFVLVIVFTMENLFYRIQKSG